MPNDDVIEPKRQSLVVVCATLVAIPCCLVLLGNIIWLISFSVGGGKDDVKPVIMLSLTVPILVILAAEYVALPV